MAPSDLQIAANLTEEAVDESPFESVPFEVYEAEQAPARKPEPLPVVYACDLDGPAPVRRWHVEDMIPADTITLLNGDGGTGKSLLALQLAVATVSAGYWAGKSVTQGTSLFLSAEDDIDEIHRRLGDVAAMNDLSPVSLGGVGVDPVPWTVHGFGGSG